METDRTDALREIAKKLDNIIARKAPGQVQEHQIVPIAEVFLDRALSQVELAAKKAKMVSKKIDLSERREGHNPPKGSHVPGPAQLPKTRETYAQVASDGRNRNSKKVLAKLSLSQPFNGTRPDMRLMVRLGPDSPHRNEHQILLSKRANSVLPSTIVLGRVTLITSKLA